MLNGARNTRLTEETVSTLNKLGSVANSQGPETMSNPEQIIHEMGGVPQ